MCLLLYLRRGIRRICKPAILQGGKERAAHLSGKTLLESLKYRPETYELEMDGSTLRYKAFLIAAETHRSMGTMRILPHKPH